VDVNERREMVTSLEHTISQLQEDMSERNEQIEDLEHELTSLELQKQVI